MGSIAVRQVSAGNNGSLQGSKQGGAGPESKFTLKLNEPETPEDVVLVTLIVLVWDGTDESCICIRILEFTPSTVNIFVLLPETADSSIEYIYSFKSPQIALNVLNVKEHWYNVVEPI